MPCSRVQAADQVDHVLGLGVAHAGGRLVEQQQARLEAERHRDFDDALVAVRELADHAVGLAVETDDLDQLLDAAVDRRRARCG